MSVKVWWPLFPLLFLIVLVCLITALVRVKRRGGTTRNGWLALSLALFFYLMTWVVGEMGMRWLHMPVSNIAELFILFNIVYFTRMGWKDIAWLNVVALVAIAADFALHYILK
ncbi:MAG: hypothetical protein LLH30_02565 [Candidatus Manganitrophus sp. SA1]|nr:hypothetical protein [Candidatus Manganitrophus morganii]